jgi:hypothetical protein
MSENRFNRELRHAPNESKIVLKILFLIRTSKSVKKENKIKREREKVFYFCFDSTFTIHHRRVYVHTKIKYTYKLNPKSIEKLFF